MTSVNELLEKVNAFIANRELPGSDEAERILLASFRRRNPFRAENEFTTILQTCQEWKSHYCIDCQSKYSQFLFVSDKAGSIEQLESHFTNTAVVTATDLFERFATAEETMLTGAFVETLLRCGGDYLCQKTVIVTRLDDWATSYHTNVNVLNETVKTLCGLSNFVDSALKYSLNASKVQFVLTGFKNFEDNRLGFRLSAAKPKAVDYMEKLGTIRKHSEEVLPFKISQNSEVVPVGWHVVYEQCLGVIGLKIREIFLQADKQNTLSCEVLQSLLRSSSEEFAKWRVAKSNKRPKFQFPVESIIFANPYITNDHYVFYAPIEIVSVRNFNDENINDVKIKTHLSEILYSPMQLDDNALLLNTAESDLKTSLTSDTARVYLRFGYLPASNHYLSLFWRSMQRIIDETLLTEPKWKDKLFTDITLAALQSSEPFKSVLFSVQQLLENHQPDKGSVIDYLMTRVNDATKKLLYGTQFGDSPPRVVIVWMHSSGSINNRAEKCKYFEVLDIKLYIGIR
uniref:VWFA domain-containing protein n=1 Tax=Panagrellus redivivus TaxID=6233 RepID=A0A7E4VB98_PANRE